jgi:glucokinase
LSSQGDQYSLGIDLGGTTFSVGVFDGEGRLVDRGSYDTPVGASPDALVSALERGVRQHGEKAAGGIGSLVGVAIGFPGPVDPDAGVVKQAPNIRGLGGFPLTRTLGDRLGGIPVHLQNDAYCATLAELRWGAGKEADNLLMFTLGTGVGGGVAMNNRVIRGPRQILGEVGHIVIEPNGRKCGCGNFGCLEAMAAKQAIIDMAARAIQSGRPTLLNDLTGGSQCRLTPQVVTEACEAGDAAAIDVYQRAGYYIGLALCNCIVLCDPDLIVIGGGIAAAGKFIFDPIKRTVAARSLISGFDVQNIVPARFGNDAGVYGAGALAWEQA